jgi:2-oxoglutarate ferredoxin oxidoreductase subunit gamma
MLEKMILAGFGGQGIMFLGKLMCLGGMNEGLHVTYIPSYGAEMRGGTANCHVVISSNPVGSPMVEKATTIITMNQPSYDKFKSRVRPGGLLMVNSSLIKATDPPAGVTVRLVPVTEMATNMGDVRLANMVMLGALNAVLKHLPKPRVVTALEYMLGAKKDKMLAGNLEAIEAGEKCITEGACK